MSSTRSLPPKDAVRTAVIVVAAGSGTRLGREVPKAFVELSGRTILEHCLRTVFLLADEVQVIVVAPVAFLAEAEASARNAAGDASRSVTVVSGGATRQQSVAAGLAQLAPDIDVVLVHDSARAFTPAAQIETVIATVRATGGGVIPGLPVSDTIKRVDAAGLILETVDRAALVAVQTPQGFPRAELVAAYAIASDDHTDDAGLFALAGYAAISILGDPLAFKITTPWDLRRAELLAEGDGLSADAQHTGEPRTGFGLDVHAYDVHASDVHEGDTSTPLWLGGLLWPGEPGLSGHSDGDAVCHAICDALLSAAGLGDIGGNFGTADPQYANARGEVFVKATVELLREKGHSIDNVVVQIVGNKPKLAPRRLEMEALLTSWVGAPVSVSATTSDGLGFTGRGEGLCAISTALIHFQR
jgi:2-C-methyl-D-erythritol 4-phosphate cytidylyltransferase/2-C-methyl-D-erythritol 2,4-cyclodiphosphate synthase